MQRDKKTGLHLTLIYALHLTAFCIFYNFFSMYLLDHGYNASQAGIVLSLCSLISMAAQPIWGGFADRQGTQKRLILIMYLLGGVAVLLIYFFSGNYPLLVILALCFAATELSTPPLLNAMTLQASQGANVSFGRVRGVSSLIYSCFALVCGNLIARTGYVLSFSVHSLCILLILLLIIRLPLHKIEAHSAGGNSQWHTLIKNASFVRLIAAAFFIFAGYCVTMDLLSVILVDRGGNVDSLGVALFICGSLEALFTLSSQKLIKSLSIRRVLAASMVFFCLKLIALFFSRNVGGVMASLLLQGLCLGIYYPISVVYIDRIVSPESRNLAQGVHAAITYGASSVIGNFMGGRVATAHGVNAMLALGALLCIIGTVIFIVPAFGSQKKR